MKIGFKHTEETKRKISISSMGKKGTYGHLGKKHSEESKQKMSLSHKGRPTWNSGLTKEVDARLFYERPSKFKEGHSLGVRFGRDKNCSEENHYNWQGGISKEPYGRGWTNILKEGIRLRDNYKCRQCGCPQEECKTALAVHHINKIKTDLSPENLITLCFRCHTKIHRKTLQLNPDCNP